MRTTASAPGGLTSGWYQGDQTTIGAKAGPANSYLAANYNNAPVGGTIATMLVMATGLMGLAAMRRRQRRQG